MSSVSYSKYRQYVRLIGLNKTRNYIIVLNTKQLLWTIK